MDRLKKVNNKKYLNLHSKMDRLDIFRSISQFSEKVKVKIFLKKSNKKYLMVDKLKTVCYYISRKGSDNKLSCKKGGDKMKLKLKFQLENSHIPYEYRKAIISLFKECLSDINGGKYFDVYFSANKRKSWTFAVGLPKATFRKDHIELDKNELTITFSTADELTGYIFYSAFIAQKEKARKSNKGYPLYRNSMKLISIQKLPDQTVKTNTALVKMLSPLCLREHENQQDTYYSVASKDFASVSNRILARQLESESFSEEMSKEVEIIPINAKKTVVKHYGNYIEVSIGEFLIKGDKAIINYFLQSGIGSRKSAGFGCLQLISE